MCDGVNPSVTPRRIAMDAMVDVRWNFMVL